ncbi:MAG: histidine phosphatase family protein [Gammaproteobacteria bacterium]|jgi:phosphohistidine phosphatase SixA
MPHRKWIKFSQAPCDAKKHKHQKKLHLRKTIKMRSLISTLILTVLLPMSQTSAAADKDFWGLLHSGHHLALIRHALAPGFSDPKGFDLGECNSQRNLDSRGRTQSRNIGALFRSNGVDKASIYSSQWCRCLETSKLMNLGKVKELPALNSFFENFERKFLQTDQLLSWINTEPLNHPTILVTHQVNIFALTGHSTSSGEIVFVRRNPDGTVTVVGNISTLP